jgi:hypothetical protein
MRSIVIAAAAAFSLAAAAAASTEAFDNWVAGLSQNGWRLVAVSEPQKSAMLMGADTQDETGRRITSVRYEFMGAAGGFAGLVAHDAIDCKAGTITRLKVTGYSANNLGGQTVEEKADGGVLSTVPNTYQEEEAHYACGLAVTLKIATASADPKKKPPADDSNKMICRNEQVIGSTIPIRRCMTKLQYEERRKADQEQLDRGQRVERITESAGPVFKGP